MGHVIDGLFPELHGVFLHHDPPRRFRLVLIIGFALRRALKLAHPSRGAEFGAEQCAQPNFRIRDVGALLNAVRPGGRV
jgi:hypothetical protein